MRLAILTPNLPPIACGLADHSRLLGAALMDCAHEVTLIGKNGSPRAAFASGWRGGATLWNGSSPGLLDLLGGDPPDCLFVQLSGYGYSRWGAPLELAKALRKVGTEFARMQLAICVHETHCDAWQLGLKGLLLSWWQKHTVGAVVRSADIVFATIPTWRDRCIECYGIDPVRIQILPLGASFPFMEATPALRQMWRANLGLAASDKVALALGRWDTQRSALERFEAPLAKALMRGEVTQVVALGGESPDLPRWAKEWVSRPEWVGRLRFLGPQTAERVAESVAAADIGLVPTPFHLWEKSTVAKAFQQADVTIWVCEEGSTHRVLKDQRAVPTWPELGGWVSDRLQQ